VDPYHHAKFHQDTITPFRSPSTRKLHFDPIFSKNANFWPIFDGTLKISSQKGINNGDARV